VGDNKTQYYSKRAPAPARTLHPAVPTPSCPRGGDRPSLWPRALRPERRATATAVASPAATGKRLCRAIVVPRPFVVAPGPTAYSLQLQSTHHPLPARAIFSDIVNRIPNICAVIVSYRCEFCFPKPSANFFPKFLFSEIFRERHTVFHGTDDKNVISERLQLLRLRHHSAGTYPPARNGYIFSSVYTFYRKCIHLNLSMYLYINVCV
jgi:hypothetical protein